MVQLFWPGAWMLLQQPFDMPSPLFHQVLIDDIKSKTGARGGILPSEELVRYAREADCVINATPMGLKRSDRLPIPPEARTKLFEKYATKGRREWHNAGLGLYLCKLVAEAHRGTIALVDRKGWSVSFEALLRGS